MFICEVKQPNFFFAIWGQLMNFHIPAGREPKVQFLCLLFQGTCAKNLPRARFKDWKALNVAVSEGGAGYLDSLPSPTSSKPLRILPKACLSLRGS